MKNIVLIGGGSGTFTLLSGLRQFPSNNSVIVSTADDGGSTGVLRQELGVMPAGDIRQCLIGLSYTTPTLEKLFKYRFDKGTLKGHAVGNIILAALEKITGNSETAIEEIARLLNVRGEVIFSAENATTLTAIFEDGKKVVGEHNIDEPKGHNGKKITKLLLSASRPNPKALEAIVNADAVVFGPGDLYTSTLSNLIVKGISNTIGLSKGKKILITNLMTKYGQTDKFVASDFLKETNKYLAKNGADTKIDVVVVNTKKPSAKIMSRYKAEKAIFVEPDLENLKKEGIKVVAAPILWDKIVAKQNGDSLMRSYVRHDPEKTASIIWDLIR